jgi:hypothetical protein
LPSGYETAAPPSPTETNASPEQYGQAPAKGMTLRELLDWIAYLLKKTFHGHNKGNGATPPAPADSRSKRSHARALKLD